MIDVYSRNTWITNFPVLKSCEISSFRLEISCDNQSYGCEVITKLDLLPHHLKECEHNPKKPVSCLQGCGLTVPKDEMKVILLNNVLPKS